MFWLASFAILMIHLGPMISAVQLAQQSKGAALHLESQSHAFDHEHSETAVLDHHALMGHVANPNLPDWINQLEMCGYCELLASNPLLLLVILALALQALNLTIRFLYKKIIWRRVLRSCASPRAPPAYA